MVTMETHNNMKLAITSLIYNEKMSLPHLIAKLYRSVKR